VDTESSRYLGFLRGYARALSVGDLDTVVSSWGLPAFVLADEGGRAILTGDEIREFFQAAVQWYRAQGLVEVRPYLRGIEQVSRRIAWLDVEWTSYDAHGLPRATEHSRYLLSTDTEGRSRIQVAVSVPPEDGLTTKQAR